MALSIANNRIVIFGASSSYGVGDETHQGIAHRLRQAARPACLQSGVFNLGIGGTTTEDMVKRVEIELAARNPALTVFLSGCNDLPRIVDENPAKRVNLEQHRENLIQIMDCAISHGHLLMLTPFPIDLKKCNIAQSVYLSYVELQRELSLSYMNRYNISPRSTQHLDHTPVVDMIDLYDMIDENTRQQFQAADGLHYNQHGHQFMFQCVNRWINQSFATSS